MWWFSEVEPLEVIRSRCDHEGRALMMRLTHLTRRLSFALSLPCEGIAKRRQPYANQEEGLHQTQDLSAPWSWMSQLPELLETNVYCLSYSACDIEQTKTKAHLREVMQIGLQKRQTTFQIQNNYLFMSLLFLVFSLHHEYGYLYKGIKSYSYVGRTLLTAGGKTLWRESFSFFLVEEMI